jgi:hypothetical protein
MQQSQEIQELETRYTFPDQLFLIKKRLNEISSHSSRYSKSKLVEQIEYLRWLAEEI